MDSAGGATSGYCAMGNWRSASVPPSRMTMAMTQANTGRSMKKWASTDQFPGLVGAGAAAAPGAPAALDAAAGPEPGGDHGTGFTGVPGGAFNWPSTITCSPGARPSLMTQSLPLMPPVFTGRGATLPSLSTIITT